MKLETNAKETARQGANCLAKRTQIRRTFSSTPLCKNRPLRMNAVRVVSPGIALVLSLTVSFLAISPKRTAVAAPPAAAPSTSDAASRQISIETSDAPESEGEPAAAVDPLPGDQTAQNAALFVGIGQFEERANLPNLRFTPDDALALAHLFVIEMKLIPPQRARLAISGEPSSDRAKRNLRELLDAGVKQVEPEKIALEDAIEEVANLPKDPNAVIVVTFASHGYEEKGIAYIMPMNGRQNRLASTGVSLETVKSILRDSPANKRLLIIDACRERPQGETRGGGSMDSALRKALALAEGTATIASCEVGQLSWESSDIQQGVFTHFLLKGLRGEAPPDDKGFITLGSLSAYCASSTYEWVRKNRNAEQQPWFEGEEARSIPLAVSRKAKAEYQDFLKRRDHLLSVLREKMDFKVITAQVVQEIGLALQDADPEAAEPALRRLEMLEKNGDVYAGDFVLWWNQVGRNELGAKSQTVAAVATTAPPEPTSPPPPEPTEIPSAPVDEQSRSIGPDQPTENQPTSLAADSRPTIAAAPAPETAPRIEIAMAPSAPPAYRPINSTPLLPPREESGRLLIDLGNNVSIAFVPIPAGTFTMGSPSNESGRDTDEDPARPVTFSRSFWMSATEITQSQYESLMGRNPSKDFTGPDMPVIFVSWDDAMAFCQELSSRTGKTFSLPTEARWEYACRGGTTGRYAWGENRADVKEFAWYDTNSNSRVKPVAQKKPNAYGLFDMAGNVREWCLDFYAAEYPSAPETDPAGPARGQDRVDRGGSSMTSPLALRSANRHKEPQTRRTADLGFRIVMEE